MAEVSDHPSPEPTLWICATPIGNFGDTSERLRQVLGQVDHVYCEDTRVTGLLLQHLGFKKPLHSCHKFSERRSAEQVVALLKDGQSVAYVSDAGTPGISDPGALLVNAARSAGFAVRPLPGPSAVATVLSVSGYDGPFAFVGFLPRKTKQVIDMFEGLVTVGATGRSPLRMAIVFYESPHRIKKSIAELAKVFPEHQAFVARELTKSYEEFFWGSLAEITQQLERKENWKGEFCGVLFTNNDHPHSNETDSR